MLRMLELESYVLDEQQLDVVRHNAERMGKELDFSSYNNSIRKRNIYLLDADLDSVVSIQDEFPIYSMDDDLKEEKPHANCTLIIRAQYPNALVVDKKFLLKGKASDILSKINAQLNKWEKEDLNQQRRIEQRESNMISHQELMKKMQDKMAQHVGDKILNKFFKENPNFKMDDLDLDEPMIFEIPINELKPLKKGRKPKGLN